MTLYEAILIALLILFIPGVTSRGDTRFQSFVPAQLLRSWCEWKEPFDNEVWLSSLRGAFDVPQIARHEDYRARFCAVEVSAGVILSAEMSLFVGAFLCPGDPAIFHHIRA